MAALVRVWMRAERVEHAVVLRAHLLRPPLLDRLDELAATGAVMWLVWHHTDPPAPGGDGEVWSCPA